MMYILSYKINVEENSMIKKTTDLGNINLSLDVVASITGSAATECYGVVGMASQKPMKDGFYTLLKKDNYAKGIVAEDLSRQRLFVYPL